MGEMAEQLSGSDLKLCKGTGAWRTPERPQDTTLSSPMCACCLGRLSDEDA